VLATEAGAWEDIVRPGTDGYIVPVNDQAAVSEKLNQLLQDPVKLTQMGANGRSSVEAQYSVQDEAQRLVDYFRTLQ
jgi:glycosyltransferase involved in cell wall biosynthesis